MTLADLDEQPHSPPAAVEGWQENCFLMGWDPEQRAGFYFHVQHRDHQEVKAMALLDGDLIWAVDQRPLDSSFAGLEVVSPFSTLRIDSKSLGCRRDSQFVGGAPSQRDEALLLDLELSAVSAPVDWSALLAAMGVAGTERDHYEQGFRWQGRIGCGSRVVSASGLAVRDHTWGRRSYDGFDLAWWTPMCFDDGTYLTGVSLAIGDRWVGGGFCAGSGLIHPHHVTATPAVSFGGYSTASISLGPRTVSARIVEHVSVPYADFGPPFCSSEGYAEVTMGERRGFGSIELNRAL